MRDKKNGETRRETKNQWGAKTRDKQKWGDGTLDKKNGNTRRETNKNWETRRKKKK